MKKTLMIFLALATITVANAQTVVVQNNNGEKVTRTTTGNGFYINGISSSQDIGGVGTEVIKKDVLDRYVKFKNYNSSPVTVLYEVTYRNGNERTKKTGSIVLKASDEKTVYVDSRNVNSRIDIENIATITRKLQ